MTIIKQFVQASIGAFTIASTLLHPGTSPAARAESQQAIATPPTTKNFLASIRREGGNCRPGGCFSEVAILSDGTYRYGDRTQQTMGKLNRLEIQRFQKRIAVANFDKIKSQPFTGTCPLAYDGPETVYTFRRGDRVEVIRSCQTQIDGKNPLFQQAERVYRQITIVAGR
jgi:hypothetical protein